MIWIDTSIPRHVAEALSLVRKDIRYVGDLYPFDRNKDVTWLSDAGRADALVILRDKHIRTRPGENRAIQENSVGAFIINQKQSPTKWQYLKLITGALDEMGEKFASTPRPFIYTVDSHGVIRLITLKPLTSD